ncbi:hypothetical protein [Halorussus caseinilyticus]|uniref:hypothetical protein n=1 Tax=Halorussus caseinilyticus TaxID=3034025 RepID=UPI0023E77E3C|nr:hypothetical protein [Halorussus sp. DT72]
MGDDEISLSKQPINRNFSYGVRLGFIRETKEGYENTNKGETLAHVGIENAEWLFEDAMKEDPLYRSLLEEAVEKAGIQKIRGMDCVLREAVLDVLMENYKFNLGKRSLKAAAATYLKTVDAAGFGTYIQGGGAYPTRLELDESIFGSFLLNERDELGDSKTVEREEKEIEEQEEDKRSGTVSVAWSKGVARANLNVDMGKYEEGETEKQVANFIKNLESELSTKEVKE